MMAYLLQYRQRRRIFIHPFIHTSIHSSLPSSFLLTPFPLSPLPPFLPSPFPPFPLSHLPPFLSTLYHNSEDHVPSDMQIVAQCKRFLHLGQRHPKQVLSTLYYLSSTYALLIYFLFTIYVLLILLLIFLITKHFPYLHSINLSNLPKHIFYYLRCTKLGLFCSLLGTLRRIFEADGVRKDFVRFVRGQYSVDRRNIFSKYELQNSVDMKKNVKKCYFQY